MRRVSDSSSRGVRLPWRVLFALLLAILLAAGWRFGPRQQPRREGDDPHGLSQKFVEAVVALRRHQDAEGAWVAYSTPHPVFRNPMTPHVSVFLPALIIDVLNPVVAEIGLDDVLERGRSFLREQIEETGLVRYLGKRG